jgi:membrane protein
VNVQEGVREISPVAVRAPAGFGRRFLASLSYLVTTEVHAYAFSIAANALLAFFPFTLLLLTLCRSWLQWQGAYDVIVQLLRANLPVGADFVIRNLGVLVYARPRVQVVSVGVLVFTSSGVFLPLEVALNKVWGIARNRSFLANLAVSFVLAVVSGSMAFCSVLIAAAAQAAVRVGISWLPWHRLTATLARGLLESVSVPLLIGIYLVIYYFLPNGPVPLRRVLPAAVLAGVLTEVAKFIYGVSLPAFRFREVYGPFELSATLLVWAFVGALILLWGASFCAYGYEPGQERYRRKAARDSGVLGLEI